MFGSQALETAIGLILMFFVIATGASAVVEIWSRIVSKRSADLEVALKALLAGPSVESTDGDAVGRAKALVDDAFGTFEGTTIYHAAKSAAGTSVFKNWKRPSYLAASAFADAVIEIGTDARSATTDSMSPDEDPAKPAMAQPGAVKSLIDHLDTVPGVQARLRALYVEVGEDLVAVKAGLERHFDDAMARLQGAYKRWATGILFVVGLVIAISANASAFEVAERLWQDPVTREAVVQAAEQTTANGAPDDLKSVGETVDALPELGLPVGWDDDARQVWQENDWIQPWGWGWGHLGYLAGWLATGLLVTLGAPFWFDLLTKAVSLRQSGGKPKPAQDDPQSATAEVTAKKLERQPEPSTS